MPDKDLIALVFFMVTIPACIIATCFSRYIREAAFFLMIALMPIIEKLSVNFDTHFWYRGTTRGFEFTCLDVLAIGVLTGSILAPRRGYARWFWPMSLGLMFLFFVYACVNVAASDPKIYGLFELSKMFRGIVFFLAAAMFIRSERELSILVLALCCAVCFEGLVALKQSIGGYLRVPGTLDDPNSLSMYLCAVTPIFVAAANSTLPKFIKMFSVIATIAAGCTILLTVSRAGIPIFGFVVLATMFMCMSWRITFKKIAGTMLIAICIGGLLVKSWSLIQERYTTDSLQREYEDAHAFESRGYYLRLADLIMHDHFYGVGLNNWSYWVSKKYGAKIGPAYSDYDELAYIPIKYRPNRTYAAPAHCLAALTVGELGIPGLILFTLVWLRWFRMGLPFLWPRSSNAMQRMGVGIFFGTAGIFLQSITEWVYHQTHIFLTFNVMLGTLAALYWIRKQNLQQQNFEIIEEFEDEEEDAEDEYESEPVAVA
jgi:hypothetical protein